MEFRFLSYFRVHRHARTKAFILLIFASAFMNCENKIKCDHYREFLNDEAHGTVSRKYLDSASHMWPTIHYTTVTGKKLFDDQIGNYLRLVYDTIEVGDMIDKDSGSSKVTVTKAGNVIIFETKEEDWCTE